jgi:hypothetical protein
MCSLCKEESESEICSLCLLVLERFDTSYRTGVKLGTTDGMKALKKEAFPKARAK